MAFDSIPFGDAMGMEVAFSNAIRVPIGDGKSLVWVSGQIAFDEDDQLMGPGDMARQTEQCIDNIEQILKHWGAGLESVTNVLIFVTSMADLAQIHKVRLARFPKPYPASTLVKVSGFVHPDAMIEIQAQAVIQD